MVLWAINETANPSFLFLFIPSTQTCLETSRKILEWVYWSLKPTTLREYRRRSSICTPAMVPLHQDLSLLPSISKSKLLSIIGQDCTGFREWQNRKGYF